MTLSGSMSSDLKAAARVERHAQLIWFDPGVTTGICAVAVRPRWLAGDGEPTWGGLRQALTMTWHGQIGQLGRTWDEERHRAARSPRAVRRAPGSRKGAMSDSGGVGAVLLGAGRNGGAAPSEHLKSEIEQLTQQIALLGQWPDAAWGYESFRILKPNATDDYATPIRVNARIEAVEIIFGEKGRVPFVQAPSYALGTASDVRLKAAGLYRPGMPHASDAARHIAVFLRDARKNEALRCQAWPRIFKATEKESA